LLESYIAKSKIYKIHFLLEQHCVVNHKLTLSILSTKNHVFLSTFIQPGGDAGRNGREDFNHQHGMYTTGPQSWIGTG
jgi:hypothetical protein